MNAKIDVKPPKVVVFDWDNTLVDSWAIIHEAMNVTLRAMGHESWDMATLKAHLALSLRDSFPSMFKDRWTEAREVYYQAFKSIHLERLTPLPGAEQLLNELRSLGIRLAVLSNKTGNFLRDEVAHLGWTFDQLTGATDAPADKPDPRAMAHTLAPLNQDPSSEVWLVGDAEVDLHCAIATGCVPVLMRSEPARPEEFIRYAPQLRFYDCDEMRHYVRRLYEF